jgi:hypothetical protein
MLPGRLEKKMTSLAGRLLLRRLTCALGHVDEVEGIRVLHPLWHDKAVDNRKGTRQKEPVRFALSPCDASAGFYPVSVTGLRHEVDSIQSQFKLSWADKSMHRTIPAHLPSRFPREGLLDALPSCLHRRDVASPWAAARFRPVKATGHSR